MKIPMRSSQNETNLTESFEQCRLRAYRDSGGVPTIAWGHTRGVKMGDTCTKEQADAWLIEDRRFAEDTINMAVELQLTQPEFDALTDFVFNIGDHAFVTSTMLRLINAGNITDAAHEFERWDKVKGKEIAGLLRRRRAEEILFNKTESD